MSEKMRYGHEKALKIDQDRGPAGVEY